jgi:hypothetical protein
MLRRVEQGGRAQKSQKRREKRWPDRGADENVWNLLVDEAVSGGLAGPLPAAPEVRRFARILAGLQHPKATPQNPKPSKPDGYKRLDTWKVSFKPERSIMQWNSALRYILHDAPLWPEGNLPGTPKP